MSKVFRSSSVLWLEDDDKEEDCTVDAAIVIITKHV